ncbi:MAG: lipopolysaccharide biosynthesis protein [Hyphomicrobiales bacterium]|nr:MAG: lipopolysaccharide biosynthesis protein [Hyphomicrobiales bacterium]
MALSYAGSGGSLILSSITQLITFAILARTLGADQFALYVTITAFTNVAVQVCGLGAQETLVRRIAQDPADYPRLMGHALLLTLGTAGLLFVAGLIVLPILVPVSPDALVNLGTIALLLISTVFVLRLVSLATASYIARSNFAVANAVEVGFGLTRLAAALLGCLVFGVTSVAEWSVWFFGAHLIIAAIAVHLIWRQGKPHYTLVREELKIGALFSTQFIFKAIRQNTDIVLLGMFTSAEIVSSYGVARRVLDSSFLSIEALNRLIYPGSAVAFANGFHNALGRVRKVMGAGVGIAIFAAVAVYVLAPLMPLLFGDEYSSMVGFTQILCWVVIPVSFSSIALDAFGAAGRQDVRALVYNTSNILAALILAVSCAVAGVQGAFVSAYAVEILTAIAACALLLRFVRSDRQKALRAAPAE